MILNRKVTSENNLEFGNSDCGFDSSIDLLAFISVLLDWQNIVTYLNLSSFIL